MDLGGPVGRGSGFVKTGAADGSSGLVDVDTGLAPGQLILRSRQLFSAPASIQASISARLAADSFACPCGMAPLLTVL